MTDTIYLDNAATTALRDEVREYMLQLMEGPYGNPSSTHSFGRKARVVVEGSRKAIAKQLRCQPGEIVFTSGGTEADNAALALPVLDLGIKRIITAPTEHHAVLHAAERLQQRHKIQLDLLRVKESGEIDLNHLEELLRTGQKALVSIMHGNNEIGNLADLKSIGNLVHQYGGLFHSDTVQTVGHFELDLSELPVDFITASSHKFYGPKGVGFLFIRSGIKVGSFITGGAQERNLRGGTENTVSIGGLTKAFTMAYAHLQDEKNHILELKRHLLQGISDKLPEAKINGLSGDLERSLYTVLSVEFPQFANDSMLLFNLDMKGIAVSGGSACASGSLQGSHVIKAIKPENTAPIIRFSIGKNNTRSDIDRVLEILVEMQG